MDSKKENTCSTKLSQLVLARQLFPKHNRTSLQPIVRSVIGVGLFVISSLVIDRKYFKQFSMIKQKKTGWFLIAYLIGIFCLRMRDTKSTSVCYEMLWGCNVSILMSGIGCIMGRPLLVGIAIGLVGLDQTMWYMDMISLILRRKYLVGAASYLSSPEQTFVRSLTSLHHLWFIPFSMYILYIGRSYLHKYSFHISMLLATCLMLYGRIMPKFVWMPLTKLVQQTLQRAKQQSRSSSIKNMLDNDHYLEYMNLNMGHEFYATVSVPFLHFCNKSPVYIYIPITASLCSVLSYFPFFLLTKCSDKYLFHATY